MFTGEWYQDDLLCDINRHHVKYKRRLMNEHSNERFHLIRLANVCIDLRVKNFRPLLAPLTWSLDLDATLPTFYWVSPDLYD